MKHISHTLPLLLAVSIMLTETAAAQTFFHIGGGIGYVSPAGDYGGATTDYYAGTKYGLSGGLNLHAKARLNLFVLRLAAEAGYSSFSNSGNSEAGKGKVDISQSVFSLRLGPEYHLSLPAMPLTPYAGVHLALNNFSGETTFNGVSNVPSGTFSLSSTTRLGLGISGGVIYSLNPLMSLDIGITYSMMNLFGQAWDDADPAKDQRIDSYTTLNDDKDPLPLNGNEHFIGNARSINAMQVTVTMMFGL